MRRLAFAVVAFSVCLFLIAPVASAQAQKKDKKGEKVRFDTYDGVELVGTFYPSGAGGNAPTVLMLHQIKGNREQDGWDDLALKLQPSYSVLIFDFRGHGDSTSVDPMIFWRDRTNSTLRGAKADKKSISFQDFPAGYLPHLVNDIAAAKFFIDKEANQGRCNSSNLIVIGAGDGGSIGALWIASEFHRRPVPKNIFGAPMPGGAQKPEGKDIMCAIWLSLSPTVPAERGFIVPIQNMWTVKSPEVKENVPMYFLCGNNEPGAARLAATLNQQLKAGKNANPKFKQITGVNQLTAKLSGRELLKKTLGTDELILKYVEKVLDVRGNVPAEKKTLEKTPFPVPWGTFLK